MGPTTGQNLGHAPHRPEAEEWRPVVGFEGRYEVSNQGRVRSLLRRRRPILRLFTKPEGYVHVCLLDHGRQCTRYVHRLVAEAFCPQVDGDQVNHLDGDKGNNRADNLEWCTPAENSRHARDVLGRTRWTSTQATGARRHGTPAAGPARSWSQVGR